MESSATAKAALIKTKHTHQNMRSVFVEMAAFSDGCNANLMICTNAKMWAYETKQTSLSSMIKILFVYLRERHPAK